MTQNNKTYLHSFFSPLFLVILFVLFYFGWIMVRTQYSYLYYLVIALVFLARYLNLKNRKWAPAEITSAPTNSPSVIYPRQLTIWYWWIGLTLIYLVLFFLNASINKVIGLNITPIVGLVGLFVPFGYFNGVFGIIGTGGLMLIVFLVILYFFEKTTKKFNLSPTAKIISILLLLLVITFLVDMLLWREWCSMTILTQGHPCDPDSLPFTGN